MGSPLDDVTPDEALQREEWWQRKHTVFADRMLRFILQYVGLPGRVQAARRAAVELTGERLIDPNTFASVYPEFPVWLGVRWITKVREDLQLDTMWKRFSKTRIFQRWSEVTTEKPVTWDGAVGLVFALPGRRGGTNAMLLHDLQVDPLEGGVWVQKMMKGRLMTLQPLVQFLDRLRPQA